MPCVKPDTTGNGTKRMRRPNCRAAASTWIKPAVTTVRLASAITPCAGRSGTARLTVATKLASTMQAAACGVLIDTGVEERTEARVPPTTVATRLATMP